MKTIQFPFNKTHSPILMYDPDTLEIIEANPAAQELYGYEKEEFESLYIHDLVPDEQVDKLEEYQKGEKETQHTSLWRNQTKSGDIIYVRILANYVMYKAQLCRFAIIHNETERVRSQRSYETEHELMKSLLDKLPGIYLVIDQDQKIHRWNQSLVDIKRDDPEALNEPDIPTLFGEKQAEKFKEAVDQTLQSGETEFETYLTDGDGEEIPILVNVSNINMDSGSYIQVVGLDISGLKKVEENLRQANREKETMLSEIHHRVKNNLAVVSSMMELQVMEEENKEVKEKLDSAKLRIQSIALIHELLYQSQSFTNIDFSENIKDLVEAISETLLVDTEVSIDYELEPVVLNVNIALPLANIANELLTNIYQHAFEDRSSGEIQIELYESDGEIHLNIRDNGEGLPKDFEPQETSGLGWSIINSLLEQIEADIEIYNDNGANFEITIQSEEYKRGSASNVSNQQMLEFTEDSDEG